MILVTKACAFCAFDCHGTVERGQGPAELPVGSSARPAKRPMPHARRPVDTRDMAASVIVGPEEITIELSGWNALPSLRRIVRIPLAAIRSIRTERLPEDGTFSALASIAGPLTGVRTGSVVHDGRRFFLAYRPGGSTVTLELDREHFPEVDYDAVVLGVDPSSVELAESDEPTAA